MIQESASTFPSHKYDFGDRVAVMPLQAVGTVEAIAYRRHDDSWHYRLVDLPQATEHWWTQDELQPDCSSHFERWNHLSRREGCSQPPNLT